MSNSPQGATQGGYHGAVISEIRMLLDFVTGSSVQTLKDLVIPDPDQPAPAGDAAPVLMKNAAVLNRLNDLEEKVAGGGTLTSSERTFVQLLRDALGVMVRPATGLTIAYSAMVVGNQRGPYTQSRAMRAEQAYASLAGPAWRHRWAQRILLGLALCVTCLAVWQSAHVALGRFMLQGVQALHAQQAALSQDMTKLLEAARPPTPASPLTIGGVQFADGPMLRLCDRPRVLAWNLHKQSGGLYAMDADHSATLFETPAQQALCDRDTILAAQFRIAHEGLLRYMSDWTTVIHPADPLGAPPGASKLQKLARVVVPASAAPMPASQAETPAANETDIDFTVAPVLLVLGNYVLPIIFALLGATVYVILDFYSKIRDSLLAPRDAVLSWIRLVLGMVLGACVGLFFSGSNPAPSLSAAPIGAALADSITLSASGLSFIAGFGVEGVFGMLDSLVRRIFSGDQDKGARLAPG